MLTLDSATPSLYFPYLKEILSRFGLPFSEGQEEGALLIIDGSTTATAAAAQRYARHIASGGSLLAFGGVAGLPDLFGAKAGRSLGEAWLRVEAPAHPFLADQCDSLHAFGVTPLTPLAGTEVLANVFSAAGAPLGAGLTVKRTGHALVIAMAADLPQTVLRIQQGWPVFKDGAPAADGSAPVDDGILKVDDGIALSYELDRTEAEEGPPYFGRPIADQWRELLLRLVLWAGAEASQPVPQLWYWPDGVEAVCHFSHDTDMCGEEPARTTLAELKQAGIVATFCVIYPERWPSALYDDIRAAGHEVAFHYNAMQDTEMSHWGRNYLRHQVESQLQDAGQSQFISSKQHVFRWHGEVETFLLLESAGLQLDGTKGGSKNGNYGMPFGSCHPWFPMAYGDYAPDGRARMIDVLALPLLTMDMAYRSPLSTALTMMRTIRRYHGVAHYGPHPIWIHTKPEVAAALHALVRQSRELGLPWWTSAAINRWERARRQISVTSRPGGAEVRVADSVPLGLPDGSLILHGAGAATVNGEPASLRPVTVHGREAGALRLPMVPGAVYSIKYH